MLESVTVSIAARQRSPPAIHDTLASAMCQSRVDKLTSLCAQKVESVADAKSVREASECTENDTLSPEA
eukprot:1844996-Alexandrium_andersonii.AAC.1